VRWGTERHDIAFGGNALAGCATIGKLRTVCTRRKTRVDSILASLARHARVDLINLERYEDNTSALTKSFMALDTSLRERELHSFDLDFARSFLSLLFIIVALFIIAPSLHIRFSMN